MKPARFDYYAPRDLQEVLEHLHQHGDDAKVLAGGQSLMPLMNMHLARPKVIIDINGLAEHSYIDLSPRGPLSVGALTRLRTLERTTIGQDWNPFLLAVMPHIGHVQIRNRGTFGGSIAHADPAAELPAITVALEAQIELQRVGSRRVVKAQDFYISSLTTAMEPVELLTEVRFPTWRGQWAWGFQEVARRRGDFALAGAIALLQLNDSQHCRAARVVMFGVGETPLRMAGAEDMMLGRTVDRSTLQEVGRMVSEELDPQSDIHASSQYRKEVGGVLARRALEDALAMATGEVAT